MTQVVKLMDQARVAYPELKRRTDAHAQFIKALGSAKRARFNAEKRLLRREHVTDVAFALAGVLGFIVPVFLQSFDYAFDTHQKNVIAFSSFSMGALAMVFGLVQKGQQLRDKARELHDCARKVNSIRLRAKAMEETDPEKLEGLLREYDAALAACPVNHDNMDWELGEARHAFYTTADEAKKQSAWWRLFRAHVVVFFNVYWVLLLVCFVPTCIAVFALTSGV